MPFENQNDPRPLSAPALSEPVSSGSATSRVCCKLVVNVTSALTSFAITTLDGNAEALGALPVGLWTFDVQFTKVTWSGGAASAVAFARL